MSVSFLPLPRGDFDGLGTIKNIGYALFVPRCSSTPFEYTSWWVVLVVVVVGFFGLIVMWREQKRPAPLPARRKEGSVPKRKRKRPSTARKKKPTTSDPGEPEKLPQRGPAKEETDSIEDGYSKEFTAELPGGAEMEFVWIERGMFTMGTSWS